MYRPDPQDGFTADELTAYETELDGYGDDDDYIEKGNKNDFNYWM